MKLIRNCALATVLLSTLTATSHAWVTAGTVYCDANHNGQIETNDTPLKGVLVVVTNTSGTFSNANWTATPDGGFAVELPPVADSYVQFLHPLTLPPDTTFVLPNNGVTTFTLNGTVTSNFFSDFLVSSSVCSNSTTPPPTNTDCCVAASGTIGGTKLSPIIRFSLTGTPSCGCTNGDSGEVDIVDNSLKLHL